MKTLNDGLESITIPNLSVDNANCRYKVKASNNIFFDINDRKFKITALSTGFNPISSSNQLGVIVSPNPFKQYFTLSVVGLNETAETNVVIYDLVGNLIFNKNFSSSADFNQEIDFSALSSGVYFVKIRNKNHSAIQRIVKE